MDFSFILHYFTLMPLITYCKAYIVLICNVSPVLCDHTKINKYNSTKIGE